jgi:hypothetical protein
MNELDKGEIRSGLRWTVAVVHQNHIMERSIAQLLEHTRPEWFVLRGKAWLEEGVAIDALWVEADYVVERPFEGPQVWLAEDKGHSLEGLHRRILDYLMVPVDPEDLIASAERIENAWNEHREEPTLLQLDPDHYERWDRVQFFEACGNYAWAHIVGKPEPVLVSRNLKKLEEELPDDAFVRSHHSYLINVYQVEFATFSTNYCRMKSGIEVPMSGRKKELVREKMAPFLMKR